MSPISSGADSPHGTKRPKAGSRTQREPAFFRTPADGAAGVGTVTVAGMRRLLLLLVTLLVLVELPSATAAAAPHTAAPIETRQIGRTVRDRPIIARRYGTPGGTPVLVVAAIHGSEPGGIAVARAIAAASAEAGYDLWVIETANPDGLAARTRQNARGVDLNRNFPTSDWTRIARGRNYSGPRAGTEPETRALTAFIGEIRPRLSIWYHQVGPVVDIPPRADARIPKRYAARVGYEAKTVPCAGGCTGNVTTWTMERVAGSTAFVVELPRTVTKAECSRHAAAAVGVLNG